MPGHLHKKSASTEKMSTKELPLISINDKSQLVDTASNTKNNGTVPFYYRFTNTDLDSGNVCQKDPDTGKDIYTITMCDSGAKMKVPIYDDNDELQAYDCYCSSSSDQPTSSFKYFVPFDTDSGTFSGSYGLESCADRFEFST